VLWFQSTEYRALQTMARLLGQHEGELAQFALAHEYIVCRHTGAL